MTEQEYKNKLRELHNEFEERKAALKTEYALSNNPYKVGDILRDPWQIIKVIEVRVARHVCGEFPECVYFGVQLTEKLVPRKRQDVNPMMWQSNVKQKLN